ncbi:putative DNA oxidative demethylase [Helianthus annuus]|nr:uncharacterized protein LOC118482152 [Helianthus annuus]KAJ0889074.1 putative DNA oxidative demethylase [Helianthus annuus]
MNYSSSFYRLLKTVGSSSLSFGNVFHGPSIGMLKQYHSIPSPNIEDENKAKPFSLIMTDRVRRNLVFDRWRNFMFGRKELGPGMVLFKNYLTHMGQVDIVNICQKWAMGPGGFYRPSNRSGAKLRLHMMCFGRLWDPVTKYEKSYRSDGSAPPPLPYEFISLAENAIEDAQLHMKLLPSMLPDICVANFYSYGDRLGLHQDCDEHVGGLDRGLPVVSVSIGESAEFLYGHTRDENKLEKVLLESGDVLIFGGKSRRIFHGVRRIIPPLDPTGVSQVIEETGLILGRLNLTLKQS